MKRKQVGYTGESKTGWEWPVDCYILHIPRELLYMIIFRYGTYKSYLNIIRTCKSLRNILFNDVKCKHNYCAIFPHIVLDKPYFGRNLILNLINEFKYSTLLIKSKTILLQPFIMIIIANNLVDILKIIYRDLTNNSNNINDILTIDDIKTNLRIAICEDRLEILDLLYKMSNLKISDDIQPYMVDAVIRHDDTRILKWIFNKVPNIDDKILYNVLKNAIAHGRLNSVKLLCTHIKNKRWIQSKKNAIIIGQIGNFQMFQLLFESCHITSRDIIHQIIYYASMNGHDILVKALINNGFIMNISTEILNKSLFIAVKNGHIKVVGLLLMCNVNLSFNDNIIIKTAIKKRRREIVEILLNDNRIILTNNDYVKLIRLIVKSGTFELEQLLINHSNIKMNQYTMFSYNIV